MKKLIIIFLSIFIAIPNGYADNVANCNPNPTLLGNCETGCGFYGISSKCEPCRPGTYNPGLSQTCEPCMLRPADADFLTEDNPVIVYYEDIAYGNTSDDCPWQLTCKAGQYWNDDEAQCTNCGEYYQDNNGSCTVIGRGDNNAQINFSSPLCDFDNRCDGNEYKLILKPNGAIFQGDIELCYKYGTGFAEKCGSTTWSQNLPKYHKDRPIKSFTGYYSDKNCSGVAIFDSEGHFTGNWSLLGGEKTLYACWKKLTQTIEYYDETGALIPGSSHTCTADDNDNFECWPKELKPTGDGKIFRNYTCKYISGNNETPCELKADGQIPELGGGTVQLTIQTDPCPAGYYCEAGTPTSCPGGSTSDNDGTIGAENINGCYMAGGKDGTQFCDSEGCFNLPDGIKIYYQGGDEANN